MRKMKKFISLIAAAAMVVTSVPISALDVHAEEAQTVAVDSTVRLKPSEASTFNDTNSDGLGEFQGWGTSLCWWANRIGYSEKLTNEALISGILAGQPFNSELSGDESLNSRPMKRIIEPLTSMGANIASVLQNGCAPLYITPAQLHGIHYDSPVASAQVKSCLLLAGLYADGETSD